MAVDEGGRLLRDRPSPHGGEDEPWAPLDAALAAYRAGRRQVELVLRTDVAEEEHVPVSLFFRPVESMPAVERRALAEARGRVLDVGAGPGAHAAPLAAAGHAVTALEILPVALAALHGGGVVDVRDGGLEALGPEERFDTVLVLMNGLGLPGTMAALDDFLAALAGHLEAGGRILADSTDPARWDVPDDGRYVGEVHMQLEFDGQAGPPFPFLFVDPEALAAACTRVGLTCEVLEREEDGRYLARMARRTTR
jgi:SAM-dependent methyltransferase